MRLYVIRHGESENNLRQCWTGWFDSQLTDKGREHAGKACTFLKQFSFDKIYTSDLRRAMETAELAIPGCSYETTPLLREINVGALANQSLNLPEGEARIQMSKCGYTEYGGESYEQLRGRVCSFMEQMETLECDTVAAFCHGGWMRSILGAVLGDALPSGKIMCRNCAIAAFDYSDGIWKLHTWINIT